VASLTGLSARSRPVVRGWSDDGAILGVDLQDARAKQQDAVGGASITIVADDRRASGGEVDASLVPSSGQ
jgi:hypothetical protein